MSLGAPTALTDKSQQSSASLVTAQISPSAGDTVFVSTYLTQATTAPAAPTVTDSVGNTYTLLKDSSSTNGGEAGRWSIYFFKYATAPGTITITITNGAAWIGTIVFSVSGVTASPLDVFASNAVNGTSLAAATTGNRTADNEMAIVLYVAQGSSTAPTSLSGGGVGWPTPSYTALTTHGDAGARVRVLCVEYQQYTGGNGATATTGGPVTGPNNQQGFLIITIQPGAVVAATQPPLPLTVLNQAINTSTTW